MHKTKFTVPKEWQVVLQIDRKQKSEAQSEWQKQVTYCQGSHVGQSGEDGGVAGKDLCLRRIQDVVAVLVTSCFNTRYGCWNILVTSCLNTRYNY